MYPINDRAVERCSLYKVGEYIFHTRPYTSVVNSIGKRCKYFTSFCDWTHSCPVISSNTSCILDVYIIFVVKASKLVYCRGEDLITIYVNYDPNSSEYHFISCLKHIYIYICFILFIIVIQILSWNICTSIFEFSLVTWWEIAVAANR